ncbi:MAG TPA: carbamate kinase, partial [Bacteroidales bacterium]|nr:carbamate kinase [Bacteroidales bacterium]
MGKLIMAAFGGNALLRGDQKGYYNEQIQNATDTCENLIPIIERGHNLVITHGNGPQVGNVLLQNEAGESKYGIPALPMHVCVAETQGHIGYLIEQAFKNVLLKHGIEKNII